MLGAVKKTRTKTDTVRPKYLIIGTFLVYECLRTLSSGIRQVLMLARMKKTQAATLPFPSAICQLRRLSGIGNNYEEKERHIHKAM
jgi:hypothetical protein